MKILHVASGDLWAGAENAVFQLAAAQVAAGNTVSAVLLNHGTLADRLQIENVHVAVLDEEVLSPLAIYRGMGRLIRVLKPEVVHTHRIKEDVLGGAAARRWGVPAIVRTVHGLPEYDGSGSPSVKKAILGVADMAACRFFQDAVVVVSEDLSGRIGRITRHTPITTVLNGLNVSAIHERARSPSPEIPGDARTPGLCLIGRLVPVKRTDLFIETARVMVSRGFSGNFYVIGEGPERHTIEQSIEKLGLNAKVHLLGHVDDPVPYLKLMSAVVMTSDHEGIPMTALEALAVGVPVVARAVGGLPEIVRGSEQGALVESDDPRRIAAAITQVLSCGPQTQQCKLPVEFTAKYMADGYDAVYRKALGTPSAGY